MSQIRHQLPVCALALVSAFMWGGFAGLPYASAIQYSHSSTLRTMQKSFDVDPYSGYAWLGAAASANDLSALFKPGVISVRSRVAICTKGPASVCRPLRGVTL
jgi:hypothetical protein